MNVRVSVSDRGSSQVMAIKGPILAFVTSVVLGFAGAVFGAGQYIEVEYPPSTAADELQRFAAGELQRYLERLFQVRAQTCVGSATEATHRFMLGLASDAHIRKAAGCMPALSPQSHLVRRISSDTMVLAGGSSAAVAWAVYELVENYGVRYLLHGDVLPERTGAFHLPAADADRRPTCLVSALDRIRQRFGPDAVKVGRTLAAS